MSRRRRAGPLRVLIPALLAALLAAYLFQRPAADRRASPPEASDPEATIAAFGGQLDGIDGSRLVARLAPLHADPERQAFEADSLRRRFDLAPGAPWRLSLRWDPAGARARGAGSGPYGETGSLAGEAPRAEVAGLGLGAVEVHDAEGAVLAPITLGEAHSGTAGEGAIGDPLRVLLAPPGGALRQGQAVDWILWGRAPNGAARLVGLLPPPGPDADAFEAATGLRGPLAFESEPVRRSELLLPIARLDRPVPGKAGRARSSEEARATVGAEDD